MSAAAEDDSSSKEATRVTTAPAEQETFRDWIERNPLRAWRKANRRSILQTAAELKAAMTSIQLWERGVHVPGERHMDAIAALTEDDGIAARWAEWKDQQPTP